MNITEVRVKLVGENSERLRAFCSVTLDGAFVIRDLKVIDGINGAFVAMPSRKLTDKCPKCSYKNHLRARFCNECGARLKENRAPRDPQGRSKLHADVAHPINTACRERIQQAVIEAYEEESGRSEEPDYRPVEIDEDDSNGVDFEEMVADMKQTAERATQRGRREVASETMDPAPEEAVPPEETRGSARSAPEEHHGAAAPAGEESSSPSDADESFAEGIL